ncbi:MAG: GntR family transcriptional regulator [Phycisphaerales bacterium]|nr:GntR family transcriptional regulator [Phycisphaerales bacterium]
MNIQTNTIATGRPPVDADAPADVAEVRLSYKFQRLREKLREAVTGGEFQGKLPGERQLAKRFGVNAKTLSKALTDLAAEGLLDRSIGRGTFVKGSAPAPAAAGRWLVLADAASADSALVRRLRLANPELVVCTDFAQIRPSFLSPFSAVLDLCGAAPESVVRDLVVRNLPLVAVGHEPRTFAMHCVVPDEMLAGTKLGRDLLFAGHRRLVAVEAPGRHALTQALRQAAARYAPDATVDACAVAEVPTLLRDGAVAFVCESPAAARQVRAAIAGHATADVALAAVGTTAGPDADLPCSGYYVDCAAVADAVVGLLADPPARPTTLWLTCEWADRGTIVPPDAAPAPIELSAAQRAVGYAGLLS